MSAAYREKKYSKNDPATITRLAGVVRCQRTTNWYDPRSSVSRSFPQALQRVEHIAMDHGIPTEWESVQTTSMKRGLGATLFDRRRRRRTFVNRRSIRHRVSV